jgi:hypothetical protein
MTVTAMLIGQISSAYSFPRVKPSGSVIAAATMIACQPPEIELRGDQHADQHPHRAPDHGGEEKLADDLVVELEGDFSVGVGHGTAQARRFVQSSLRARESFSPAPRV